MLSGGGDSPFEVVERKEEVLGFVRVVQSKETLSRILAQIFLINVAVSLVFAVVFLIVLRKLAESPDAPDHRPVASHGARRTRRIQRPRR